MRMDFTSTIPGGGLSVHAWLDRLSGSPPRPIVYLARWPAVLTHLDKDQAFKLGIPQATHALSGPIWPNRYLQAGDLLVRCVPRDGRDYVRPGKPWSVVERRHEHGYGDVDHQTVYLTEEV